MWSSSYATPSTRMARYRVDALHDSAVGNLDPTLTIHARDGDQQVVSRTRSAHVLSIVAESLSHDRRITRAVITGRAEKRPRRLDDRLDALRAVRGHIIRVKPSRSRHRCIVARRDDADKKASFSTDKVVAIRGDLAECAGGETTVIEQRIHL